MILSGFLFRASSIDWRRTTGKKVTKDQPWCPCYAQSISTYCYFTTSDAAAASSATPSAAAAAAGPTVSAAAPSGHVNWLTIPSAILFYDKGQPYYEFTNFQEGYPLNIDGKIWPTSEHYFQAQKFVGNPCCKSGLEPLDLLAMHLP